MVPMVETWRIPRALVLTLGVVLGIDWLSCGFLLVGPAESATGPWAALSAPAQQTTKKKAVKGRTARKKGKAEAAPAAEPAAAPAGPGTIKFSQDVAPILVANCTGCHSGKGVGARRGKLDLSTFEKLQAGTPGHKVIVPGNPDESHLILRVSGEEMPRMPQGGQNVLSEEAVAKIRQWVKEGARLDAGIDPKATLESYASSPEELRRRQLLVMPPAERDKKVEATGRERYKQANSKLTPTVTSSEHFMVFATMPEDRLKSILKTIESQYAQIRQLLGRQAADPVEKIGLYYFSERNDFVEFVRTVESRDVAEDQESTSQLGIPQPYVAVRDPASGQGKLEAESGAASKKGRGRSSRTRRGEAATQERSLVGLTVESLAVGLIEASGKPPRWIAHGVGAYMASRLEPRAAYFARLRRTAYEAYQTGWETKAIAALGGTDQTTALEIDAVGFAVVEAIMGSEFRPRFPAFVSGMLAGSDKLDDVLMRVFGASRDQFLKFTVQWVESYGSR